MSCVSSATDVSPSCAGDALRRRRPAGACCSARRACRRGRSRGSRRATTRRSRAQRVEHRAASRTNTSGSRAARAADRDRTSVARRHVEDPDRRGRRRRTRRPRASHSSNVVGGAHRISLQGRVVRCSGRRCGVPPTSATAARRSARNSSTIGALPALTVACSESGGFWRSRYQPARVQRVAEREHVDASAARQREHVRVGLADAREAGRSRARPRRSRGSRRSSTRVSRR